MRSNRSPGQPKETEGSVGFHQAALRHARVRPQRQLSATLKRNGWKPAHAADSCPVPATTRPAFRYEMQTRATCFTHMRSHYRCSHMQSCGQHQHLVHWLCSLVVMAAREGEERCPNPVMELPLGDSAIS
eukprot:scaffold7601_cov417-Prasinococcus_capsulatus_cf.AAC.3